MKKILFLIFALLFFSQPCFAIKIGLQTEVNRTYIGASTSADIIDCKTNKLIYTLEKMQGYEFKPYKNVIAIKVDGEFMKINSINQQSNKQNFRGGLIDKGAQYDIDNPKTTAFLAGASVITQKVIMSSSEAVIGPVMDVGIGHTLTKAANEKDNRTNESSASWWCNSG
jgi:hypothetical protein